MGTVLDFAPYTPFDHPRTVGPPGLSPMDMADWTVVHPDYSAQMAYREDLLTRKAGTVLAGGPGCGVPHPTDTPLSGPAAQELLDAVLDHLSGREDYAVQGNRVTRPDGGVVAVDRDRVLPTIGRLVAEDFCLLLPGRPGEEYLLVAAVLCFPSRWLLSEKMHRPLTAIHDPVPHYDQGMARRVNRVFDTLRPGRALARANWLVHGDPELHRPMGREGPKLPSRQEPWDAIYLRTERQSLVKLPRTGAVAFGIKTSMTPLECLTPPQASALYTAMGGLDDATLDYSERGQVQVQALAALKARLDG